MCQSLFTFFTFRTKVIFFFFNDTATTEIYTLSLHDALPICRRHADWPLGAVLVSMEVAGSAAQGVILEYDALRGDRKSTRLNSSHSQISYAVFCLKKKKMTRATQSK